MMRVEILDGDAVVNVILATPDEAEQQFPGAWRIAAVQAEPDAIVAPPFCTAAQGERALFDLRGIKSEHVLAAIAQIADPDQQYRAHSAYTRATEWRRDSETTQTLAAILGLTESDMDELFAYAVTVNV